MSFPSRQLKSDCSTPANARQARGLNAHLAGDAAERSVERIYLDRGYHLAARRWRGKAGEIDLIFRDADGCVFVEVKKSRSFDHAALRISAAQTQRIFDAASEFVANEPTGQLTNMRFDAALVNGTSEIQILENALMA